jgi:hypothetical protein
LQQQQQSNKEAIKSTSIEQLGTSAANKNIGSLGNMSMAESMDGSFYGAYDHKNIGTHDADNIPVESRPKAAG